MSATILLSTVAVLFIVTHLGISSSPLRGGLIGILGENGYLGLYSLISLGVIVWLSYIYAGMDHGQYLWAPGFVSSAIARALMPIAMILLVAGFATRNPTAMKMEDALDQEPRGILRITRHPVQWAILLWALAHLLANGDVASLIFFGAFAIVAGLGTVLIDRKVRAREGARWEPFERATSNLPFAAIVTGRNRFVAGELGLGGIAIAVVLFVVLYMFHDLFSGVALYGS